MPERLGGVVGSAISFAELVMVSAFDLAVLFVKLTVHRIELAVLFDELAELLEFPMLLAVAGDLKDLLAIENVLIHALPTLYLYQMV